MTFTRSIQKLLALLFLFIILQSTVGLAQDIQTSTTSSEQTSFSNENVHVNKNDSTVENVTTDASSVEMEPYLMTDWQSIVFGESTSQSKTAINVLDDHVSIKSIDNGGKFLISGSDGIAFYYTQIPKEKNFILKGKITINSWKYTNAQEGFAVLARDIVPTENLYGAAHYSNSYAFLASKMDYTWNSDLGNLTTGNGQAYSMKLGLGTRFVQGVIGNPLIGPSPGSVTTLYSTLDTSAPQKGLPSGTYNIIGNADTSINGTIEERTTFDITMKKTNTGFEVYYTHDGITESDILYDWESLYVLDPENIYVGFATARNMDISVTDIELSLSDASTDPPSTERPIKKIEPVYSVTSSNESGTSDHKLRFRGNADGVLSIKNSLTETFVPMFENLTITANQEVIIPVTLQTGENPFEFSFTPNRDFHPEEYAELSNYDSKTISHSVLYQPLLYDTIYVAPTGLSSGDGTIQNPLNLSDALKFVRPGMMVVLANGHYKFDEALVIPKGKDGTNDQPITVIAEKNDTGERPILDFNRKSAGFIHWGNYWLFRGFDVTNTADMQKGIQVSGSHNLFEDIQTYKNGNTGLQISGISSDLPDEWPADNLIKNCTSFENADIGFEDADGFAAKLTVGDGNVFDGCISYHNADDGWDLFAKNETGSIGKVVIKNSVAYRNGWLPTNELQTGNGNGFKMGGSSLSGKHELVNSLSFENLAKGIDSNSGTDISVKSSSTFNNQSYNIALYTASANKTDFSVTGLLSFRTNNTAMKEQMNLLAQDDSLIYTPVNYFWNVTEQKSSNSLGLAISPDWFESLNTTSNPDENIISRYDTGSINVHGLMQFNQINTELYESTIGARFDENTTPSSEYPFYELVAAKTASTTPPTEETSPILILEANGVVTDAENHITAGKPVTIGVREYQPNKEEPVLGDARFTPITWTILNSDLRGDLTKENLATATLTAPDAGLYTIEVTYQVVYFNGMDWITSEEKEQQQKEIQIKTEIDETKESSFAQSTDSTIVKNEQKYPNTGEQTANALYFLGILLVVSISGYSILHTRKRN